VLIPLAALDPKDMSFSVNKFCEMLGINRKAKYLISAIANREKYNDFLKLDDEIKVGEFVTCRGGDGELLERGADGSLT